MSYNATMPISLQRIVAIVLVCIVAPLFLVIALLTLIDSGWPVIYRQRRAGKDKKPFWIWKFRTMKKGAAEEQKKYLSLNEADGPVFKIRHDPRFTKFGKWLSWSGLDELPQLINVIRGEMVLVGPRPLPVSEAKAVPNKYSSRFRVLPGITSPWVIQGAHALTFKQWMESDLEYATKKSVRGDLSIIMQTGVMIGQLLFSFLMSAERKMGDFLIKNKSAVLLVIVTMGALLRIIRMNYEIIWNDEMFYLSVVLRTPLFDLIKTNHWIIDHPPLYFILQYFWSLVSTSAGWLRAPNIIFYLLSSYFIHKIGAKLFRSPITRLMMNAVYAFFPYFVGLDWEAIPYAMTISFFLMSMYYFWRVVTEAKLRTIALAALFTALFAYSSFEAGYYIVSLLLFWIAAFPFINKTARWRMIGFFCLTLILVLPEIWVLLRTFEGFAKLSTHWLIGRWEGRIMLYDVFGVSNFSFILLLSGLGAIWLIIQMLLTERTRLKTIWLGSLFGGFFIALGIVSKYFFYASNPKGYYYFILVAWMLLLSVMEWGKAKYGQKFSGAMMIFILSILVWFYPSRSWIRADYLYVADVPEPYTIREKLMEKLREDDTWLVLTDHEMGGDHDFNGYYIDSYYLTCLDMPKSSDCQRIVEARKPLQYVLKNENNKVLGVLADFKNQKYFERGVCVLQVECLVWDFPSKSFIKVEKPGQ
jgi:lipopolysaccharide/colanic/teichoic acid biosynthesis glycosyltransferase